MSFWKNLKKGNNKKVWINNQHKINELRASAKKEPKNKVKFNKEIIILTEKHKEIFNKISNGYVY